MKSRWVVAVLAAALVPAGAEAALELGSRTLDPPAGVAGPGLRIARVSGRVGAAHRAELAEAGARVLGYVPEDALLVWLDAAAVEAVAAKPWLAALVPLEAADKVSPRVGRPAWPDEADLADRLVVQAVPGTDLPALALRAALFTGGGIEVVATSTLGYLPRATVQVPPATALGAALALAALPEVVWVEPLSRVRTLNDTSIWVGQSWDTVGFATPVFAHGLFGAGQIVGVSDTGLDADHGSFYDTVQGIPGPVVNPLQRKVIAYHDRLLAGDWDSNGHGTHVAGTIAGDRDGDGRWDQNGATQAPDGMAPAAKLTISDANDTDLPGNPIDLRELFEETYDDGARIHSNSWASCSCNEYTVHSQDVDDFLWSHRDMAIFFAAGNSGPGAATVLSPGTAKDCITVGATQRGAAADALAGFSSRGPTDDGRRKPTVTAPGVNIRSAAGDRNIASFNDGVRALSGTSMATPTASGLGTLAREYLVKGFYPGGVASPADAMPSPSAALVKAVLINSARNMLSETAAPSDRQGWGRILLDDVLYFPGDARRLWLVDETRGLSAPGEKRTFPIAVGAAPLDLKVTLTWTDPPALTLVGPKIVNDLDLVVSGPGGTFRGNSFSGEWSVAGGSADRLNVEEGVRIQTPAAGEWTVTVEAANVPFGPQPYALVVTGDVAALPHLGYRRHQMIDPDGDGDGSAEPGELVRLAVTLGEDAGAPATGIRARLVPLVPWARVVGADTAPFADAAAGGETTSLATWQVAIDPAAPCGEAIPFGLAIDSDQGSYEDGFAQPVGSAQSTAVTLLADSFDAIPDGSPPDPGRWAVGFIGPPPVGASLRVAADASIAPAGSSPASGANALYVGRSGGTTAPTATYLQTRSLDLSAADRARFSFRYWVRSLEGGVATRDRMSLYASTDGGLSFPVLLYNNPDYISGMDSSSYPGKRWHDVTVDLGAAGLLAPDLTLRFEVAVNADEPNDAVYLDDVTLVAETVRCEPGCITPVFAPSATLACQGTATTLAARVDALGFGGFDAGWSFGDGDTGTVPAADAPIDHVYAAGGTFTATLETVSRTDPGCRRGETVQVEVDAPPLLLPWSPSPVCAVNPAVTLRASVALPGHGPMTYRWSFGDGSPDQAVGDPTSPVVHVYPAVPASYTALLVASDTRLAGCERTVPVAVEVVASAGPAGRIGNVLKAVKGSPGVDLDWSAGALTPRTYNLHRTLDPTRLGETAAVLGATPMVASPTGVERATDRPPGAPLWLYKVAGRDTCTGWSVFP